MLRSSSANSVAHGRTYTLKWECIPADASVKIELTHSSLAAPLVITESSTGGNLPSDPAGAGVGFDWTVPTDLVVQANYRMRVSSTVDATLFDDSLSFQILDDQGRSTGSGRRLQSATDDIDDQVNDECSSGRMLFAVIFLMLAAFCALMAFQVNKAKKESQMMSCPYCKQSTLQLN